MNKFILVNFNDNWADEMDIEGAGIYLRTEIDAMFEALKEDTDGFSIYLGTNQEIEYDSGSEVISCFSIYELPDGLTETQTNWIKTHLSTNSDMISYIMEGVYERQAERKAEALHNTFLDAFDAMPKAKRDERRNFEQEVLDERNRVFQVYKEMQCGNWSHWDRETQKELPCAKCEQAETYNKETRKPTYEETQKFWIEWDNENGLPLDESGSPHRLSGTGH